MFNTFINTLFPNRCLACNSIIPGNETVCEWCFSEIHFTHFDYFEPHFFQQKCNLLFPTERAFALMYFSKTNLAREIIHALKYRGREKIGKNLAEWTIEKLDFQNEKPDLLIGVPLHPKKQKNRGYNQLHLFTENLSEYFKIPYQHNVFQRNTHTKAQALKSKKSREKSQNLFSLNAEISHQHILLIDDVFTTGNTLSNLAWQLIQKDNKVSVLVMAWEE